MDMVVKKFLRALGLLVATAAISFTHSACTDDLGGQASPARDPGLPCAGESSLLSTDAGSPPEAAAAPLADAPPKVVFISVDGLRPDAIVKAPAPRMLDLACKGAFSWRAQTIHPSLTLPSHASMVSGFPAEVHGITWNDWRPGHVPVPTIFGAVHAAGYRTVMVVGKEKLQQLAIPGTVDTYVYAPGGDEDVATNAIIEVQRGFDLMFVHFPLVDYTGHTQAWMSAAYLKQVALTDVQVGRVVDALPPGTTVIVTSDHGGKGFIHWSDLAVDYTIPWIITGPRIKVGHQIQSPISTMDTAATIAFLFGVQLQPAALGRPVQEPFRF